MSKVENLYNQDEALCDDYHKGFEDGQSHQASMQEAEGQRRYILGFEDGKKAAFQWLPIEQAPKDGKDLLAINKNGWFCLIRASEKGIEGCTNGEIADLTHFMPLPPIREEKA